MDNPRLNSCKQMAYCGILRPFKRLETTNSNRKDPRTAIFNHNLFLAVAFCLIFDASWLILRRRDEEDCDGGGKLEDDFLNPINPLLSLLSPFPFSVSMKLFGDGDAIRLGLVILMATLLSVTDPLREGLGTGTWGAILL